MSVVVQALEPDLVWVDGSFHSGLAILVDNGGRITGVQPAGDPRYEGVLRQQPGRALVPGLVNAHSHAFQRGLRGRAERSGPSSADFWTWRAAMYLLANSLDAERLYDLCVAAYREMRATGITAVGEFHYLHHDSGTNYALDEAVLAAAHDAPIRLVLLQTAYESSGFGRPLAPEQKRFNTSDRARFWGQVDGIEARLHANQSLGIAGHSVRAVAPDDLAELRAEAARRAMPFHLHLEEQPAEIDAAVAALGHTPMRAVLDRLQPLEGVTAVHCTHSVPEELAEFLDGGGRVCVCPLTEANLGDGLPHIPAGAAAANRICLGTDSNARISMIEEMRWLELGQRLRSGKRAVLVTDSGDVAPALLRAGTSAGAAALGLDCGEIRRGALADFALLDLEHPALAGASQEDLAAWWLLGAGDDAVCASALNGEWIGRSSSA